ncbi:hypothetical protein QE152_g4840 [Popillia japonica]|uniref:Uncharacterized protein n=1 Tax=Popillia japonica TaxID=7064 RepID=A0AAW1N0U1_POPJA
MKQNLDFIVSDVKTQPILGLQGCTFLNLIQRINVLNVKGLTKDELLVKYSDVFTGLGEIEVETDHKPLIQVETDHKPLIHIFEKDLSKIPSRLQRMILKLMKYNLEVKYLPADALSRAYLKDPVKDDKELENVVHIIEKNLATTEARKIKLAESTRSDEVLKKVLYFHKNGWPEKKENIQEEISHYWKISKELKPLSEGESVLINKGKVWERGQVVEKHDTPRSYIVQTEDATYRRNRRHLRPSLNPPPVHNPTEFEFKNMNPQVIEDNSSSETESPPSVSTRPKRNIRLPDKLRDYELYSISEKGR